MTSSPTSLSRDRPIHVTGHALQRARERHPDLRQLQERDLLRTICREVAMALRQFRYAKTAPRGLLRPPAFDIRGKAGRSGRYCWNAALTRAYVIKRSQGQWVVVTVLETASTPA